MSEFGLDDFYRKHTNICEKKSLRLALCHLLNLVGSSGENRSNAQRGSAAKKKRRGDVVVCVLVLLMFKF